MVLAHGSHLWFSDGFSLRVVEQMLSTHAVLMGTVLEPATGACRLVRLHTFEHIAQVLLFTASDIGVSFTLSPCWLSFSWKVTDRALSDAQLWS